MAWRNFGERFIEEFVKSDQRAGNGNVRRHDEEECGDHHHSAVTCWQPRPTHDVCRRTKAPSANDEVQRAKRKERPRCDQNDEELCRAADQRYQESCGE